MAIEIIKQGQTKFTAHCYKCGCEFTYEMEDVIDNSVICPCCKSYIRHKLNPDYIRPSYQDNNEIQNIIPKSCSDCDFYKKYIASGKTYIGDSPCQWCLNSPYRITCTGEIVYGKE